MSDYRTTGGRGIGVLIDANSVTINMVFTPSVTIERPKTIGIAEWEEFWGTCAWDFKDRLAEKEEANA